MIQTMTLADGITLRCFYDNRFKQGALSFQMVRPVCAEETAMNALIPAVLLRGTEDHPDLRTITLHLDDLYGAAVGALVRRSGDFQTTGLYCAMMDDRFAMPGDKVMEPMMAFLEELLFRPCMEGDGFKADFVDSEKKNLISAIESDINDKRVYALKKMVRTMCREDSLGVPRLGEKEWVEAIEPAALYRHYRKILRESPINIFYVGSAPAWQVAGMLKEMLTRLERDYHPIPDSTPFRDAGGSDVVEEMDVTQAKLCMGYVTPITLGHEDLVAMQMMNIIYGSGMTSKLFMNVREKLSLCYSIGSSYDGSKGVVLLSAGIDAANEQQARDEIAAQLDAIRNGDITDEEMAAAREALLSGLRGVHDSPGSIERYYSAQVLSRWGITPEEHMAKIAAVTKEQVAAAAGLLKLHTTYILKGADHGTV